MGGPASGHHRKEHSEPVDLILCAEQERRLVNPRLLGAADTDGPYRVEFSAPFQSAAFHLEIPPHARAHTLTVAADQERLRLRRRWPDGSFEWQEP